MTLNLHYTSFDFCGFKSIKVSFFVALDQYKFLFFVALDKTF